MVDWDELVRREAPAVWRAIYRLVGNQHDADECLQETFISAVKLSARHPVKNWSALLKRVAVARAVDCVRQRLRRRRREEDTDVATVASTVPNPQEQTEAVELADSLRWALAQLPTQAAEVFCLHELEGWTYQEIGEHLSLSTSAVGVSLHRTRQKLHTLLSDTLKRHA